MKKFLIVAIILAGFSARVCAEPIDFGDFLAKARAGYAVNQHQVCSPIVYASVQQFHKADAAKTELGNFSFGYDTKSKDGLFMLGVRADNFIPMIWAGDWGKKHVTTANLPAIEFGPYASLWPYGDEGRIKFRFNYGVAIAVGFSK